MKTLASKCSAHDLLFLSTFAILIVGFIVSGYIYNDKYTNECNANVARRLSTISELKVDAITRWRKARVNDAAIFYKNAEFSALVQKCLSHAAARSEKNTLLGECFSKSLT